MRCRATGRRMQSMLPRGVARSSGRSVWMRAGLRFVRSPAVSGLPRLGVLTGRNDRRSPACGDRIMALAGVEGTVRCPATVCVQTVRGGGDAGDFLIGWDLVETLGQPFTPVRLNRWRLPARCRSGGAAGPGTRDGGCSPSGSSGPSRACKDALPGSGRLSVLKFGTTQSRSISRNRLSD